MAKRVYLTEEQKLFIIQRLACFEQPRDVIKALKEEYGHEITFQALQAYDPNKVNGRMLSKKLTEFFNATREAFTKNINAIPIANKAYRLQVLDRMAKDSKSPMLTAQLMEQAAKEVGDAYTNKHKHEVSGVNGSPIVTRFESVSPNEAAKAYADLIKGG